MADTGNFTLTPNHRRFMKTGKISKKKCPKCGGTLKEQDKDLWPGLYICQDKSCKGMHITDLGIKNFHEAFLSVLSQRN